MASGGPPEKLNERHRLMALMEVGGASSAEIAKTLGFHPNRLALIRKSDLYQAQLSELRKRLEAKRLNSLEEFLAGEFHNTANSLVELRDNADGRTPHAVRLGATNALFDRMAPKKVETQTQNNNVLILSDEAAARMASVLAEAGIVPAPVDDQVDPHLLEEFITEAAEAELCED